MNVGMFSMEKSTFDMVDFSIPNVSTHKIRGATYAAPLTLSQSADYKIILIGVTLLTNLKKIFIIML